VIPLGPGLNDKLLRMINSVHPAPFGLASPIGNVRNFTVPRVPLGESYYQLVFGTLNNKHDNKK